MPSQTERLAAICAELGLADPAGLAAALIARGVRVVADPRLFDADEQDAAAEARFLLPIDPDPLRPLAEGLRRERR